MTEERDVLLLIGDISGYTRFMVSNQTTLAHSVEIIRSLIDAIIAEVDIPLRVAKLEGDALFVYALRDEPGVLQAVREKLPSFFSAFAQRLRELALSRSCTCDACRHIRDLRLKVIIHSGRAVLDTFGNTTDLSGVDVIIAHRLLKNSVPADEYVLVTEAADRDLQLPLSSFHTGEEWYEEIGAVPVIAYGRPVQGGNGIE